MSEPPSQRRWFFPTPAWLVYVSMLATGMLFLSERGRWFAFNEHKGWTVVIAVAGVGTVLLSMLLWFVAALVFRWRFQFSIRSLLALVVAVALPCSWLAVEMKKAREQRNAVVAIRESEQRAAVCEYYYEYHWSNDAPGPSGPAWLRKLLGDDFFNEVVFVELRDYAHTENLRCLANLEFLGLGSTNVTDEKLECLKWLPRLEVLDLRSTHITDEGLGGLQACRDFKGWSSPAPASRMPDCCILQRRPVSRPCRSTEQRSRIQSWCASQSCRTRVAMARRHEDYRFSPDIACTAAATSRPLSQRNRGYGYRTDET